MCCFQQYSETVELVNIAVDEAQQGKGIGKQLVFHAIQQAKTQGFKTIEVGTGIQVFHKLPYTKNVDFT